LAIRSSSPRISWKGTCIGESEGAFTSGCWPNAPATKDEFDVYAVIDASGTWNKLVQEVAIARMAQAGIVPMTWVAVCVAFCRSAKLRRIEHEFQL
jgi:hypothetical protein